MPIVFSFKYFLMGPQNSISSKYWSNDEPEFMTGTFFQYQDIAKNLSKGQSAQNLKNGYDIYETVLITAIRA